jgi:hypothetical protein
MAEESATTSMGGEHTWGVNVWFGAAAFGAVVVWIGIVVGLHGVKSDLDPVDTYISDYAIGDNGWLMTVAFLVIGAGLLCLAAGLRASLTSGKRVVLGIGLTAVSGVGFLLAGAFTTDPTGADETTTHGALHLLGAFLVFPVAVLNAFVLLGVFRRDPRWGQFASTVRWAPWVLLVAMIIAFGVPADTVVGLTQRVFAALLMTWFAAVAIGVMTSTTPSSPPTARMTPR